MTSAYFTQADLENRVSAETVRQVFDDDNSGTADTGPLAELIADASSYVDGYLRGIYLLPLPTVPNEVKRLALDVACAYLSERHPEYVRYDGGKMMDRARKDLDELRKGKTRLDLPSSVFEGAKNEGGFIRSGNPDSPEIPPRMFTDGTGDF